jgi:hypothetical protein
LTNEHIFPNFLYEKNRETQFINIANTPTGDKAVGSELQIGDVCAKCNSGVLSQLDQYAAKLYDKYFGILIRPGDRVRFLFDYDLLARWLLKVGYNLARSRNWAISPKSPVPQYISGHIARPTGLRLFVQLVVPTPTDSIRWDERPDADEIPPLTARMDLLDLDILPGFGIAFMLSIKSFWFYVFAEKQLPHDLARIRNSVFAKYIKTIHGSYEITGKSDVTLYASSVDFMSAIASNIPFQRHVEMAREHKKNLDGRISRRRERPPK